MKTKQFISIVLFAHFWTFSVAQNLANCGSQTLSSNPSLNMNTFLINDAVDVNNSYPNDVAGPTPCSNQQLNANNHDTAVIRPGTTITLNGHPSNLGYDGKVLLIYGDVFFTGSNPNGRRQLNIADGATVIVKNGGGILSDANRNKDLHVGDGATLIIDQGGVFDFSSDGGGDETNISGTGTIIVNGTMSVNNLNNDGSITGSGTISSETPPTGGGTINGGPNTIPPNGDLSTAGPTWDGASWSITPAEGLPAIIEDIHSGVPTNLINGLKVSSLRLRNRVRLDVPPGHRLNIEHNLILEDSVTIVLEAVNGSFAALKFSGEPDFAPGAKVEIQQNLSAGWHMLSSPMNTTSASFFGALGNSSNPASANLYSWGGDNYVPVFNGDTIAPGMGYFAFVGNHGIRSAGLNTFSGVPNTNATFPPLTGSDVSASSAVTIIGPYDNGWTMLGNPFTCALDFFSMDYDGIEEALYIYDKSAGTNGGYVEISPAGIHAPYVAPLQSFWVRSITTTPTIENPVMHRHGITTSNQPTFYRQSHAFDRVVLRSMEADDPNNHDHTVIALIEGTSDGFNNGWDARKMTPAPNAPGIFTLSNDEGLAVNAIDYGPQRTDKKSIDLSFMCAKQGADMLISFDDSFMVNDYNIYLEDKMLNRFHNFKNGAYAFVNDTVQVDRFVVHFRSSSLSSDQELANEAAFRAWVYDNVAYVHPNTNLGIRQITLTDMSGRMVFSVKADLVKDERYECPLPALSAGVYLMGIDGSRVQKVVVR